MPNGRIELVHNFTGETNYVILVWRKTTAPLTIVGQQPYPAPHSQQSLLIENLSPVMYVVTAYRSLDGVTLGAEINRLACDAKSGAIYPITRYVYKVGRGDGDATPGQAWDDPEQDDYQLRDERLMNKEYWIEERGTGTLTTELNEYVDRSDDGGGFDWPGSGDVSGGEKVFNTDGVYIVFAIERVDLDSGAISSGSDWNDIYLIEDDMDFDPVTMAGKLGIAAGAGLTPIIYNIPNLNTLPDCKFKLQTHGGNQRNIVVQLDVGNAVRYLAEDMNQLLIGRAEMFEFLIKDNVLYVSDSDAPDYRRVGERVLMDREPVNGVVLDGTQYIQADVPRLMWSVDKLAAGQVVTETAWVLFDTINGDVVYKNKSKYARDDVAGTIRVPDDRDRSYKALKNLDGSADAEYLTNGAGGYQHFKTSMKGVSANIEIRNGAGGSSTGSMLNTGFSGCDNPSDWLDNDTGTGAKYIRFDASGDTETRGKAIGLLPYLII